VPTVTSVATDRRERMANPIADAIADLQPGETRVIRTGATRSYRVHLARRFPEVEWSHVPTGNDRFTVSATRRTW
jgi:hypothetical protein